MPGLLDHKGNPISSQSVRSIVNKKAPPPKFGEAFGAWAGRDTEFMTLPGGGVVQFDLSRLTVADFRAMRDHYQVNASLAVLSFMQHQSDWTIECKDKKIADFCTEQIQSNWTMLNRMMSTANWAGYSPAALNWENDTDNRAVVLDKVKDLIPEECEVVWKLVDGWAPPDRTPPKYKIYDGIKQYGQPYNIPVENSFWYPLLMENGDYQGRKLLRPAFTSWFFSLLIHLFANRYYERFGEPTPIGRAPFDEPIEISETESVNGRDYMLGVLQSLRSRSVVTLPSQRSENANGQSSFDYDIEYLESQMRGTDFGAYLTRLDEEISIGLFTPILLLRTADVGSYNLGVGHMQMYLWMLNAMNDDRAMYLDKYILRKMVNYQFSEKAPDAKIKFRKLGNTNTEMLSALIQASVSNGTANIDPIELGKLSGITITKATPKAASPAAPDDGSGTGDGDDTDTGDDAPVTPDPSARMGATTATVKAIGDRVRAQLDAAFKRNAKPIDLKVNMGYMRSFEKSLNADGFRGAKNLTTMMYARMDAWLEDTLPMVIDSSLSVDEFMVIFENVMDRELEMISNVR